MKGKWFGISVLILAGGLVAQETVFRVDVRLVRLLATVKDDSGQHIGNLSKEDFRIFDSGVEQDIAVFQHHTDRPLSVALLVDTSASTALKLKEETDSVLRFLNALFREGNPSDTVALYSFKDDVTLESTFTRRMARLEKAVKQLEATSGTSLYDALYFASQALENRDGRRVIVVVTDGADTTSNKDFHQAMESVHMADAVIYGIMVIPVTNNPGRHIAGENALITLCTGTGGRIFTSTLGDMLDVTFSDILRDLRSQYLLGYYPKDLPETKDRFHQIEVRMNNSNLRVLTRSGYYRNYGDSSQRGLGPPGPSRRP